VSALRFAVGGWMILAMVSGSASAQEWARKMFKETRHDFGTVARSAKTEFRFSFKNIYVEDVHVSGVRASCGCTTPWLTKDTLKTYDEGELVAHFNTDRFTGQRGATLTVTFDRPQFAEVQLRVDGYIRTDVVINPGSVEFGSIDEGAGAQKQLDVNYAGRGDWKIVDIKSGNPHLKAEAVETSRQGGQVSYRLNVSVDRDAAPGYLQDQLLLVTNDRRAVQVPLAVEGRVVSELTVSPSSLALGRIEPGETVTKQVVIQSKEPFRVTAIDCDNPNLECALTADAAQAKRVHLLPVRFTAGAKPGKITELIRIQTDLHGDESGGGAIAEVQATALVQATAVAAGSASQGN
jgi:hypothetical protein